MIGHEILGIHHRIRKGFGSCAFLGVGYRMGVIYDYGLSQESVYMYRKFVEDMDMTATSTIFLDFAFILLIFDILNFGSNYEPSPVPIPVPRFSGAKDLMPNSLILPK